MWKVRVKRGIITLGGLGLSTIVVEHICDTADFERRPSLYLSIIATTFTSIAEWIGRQCARISSWPHFLHLEKAIDNSWAVLKPICRTLASPLWTAVGYSKQLTEVYRNYQGTVIFGSSILLLGVGAGAHYSSWLSFRQRFHLQKQEKC